MGLVRRDDGLFAQGEQPLPGARRVDLIGFHAAPSLTSRRAIAKAGGDADICEAPSTGHRRATRISGQLVMIEANQAEIGLQLLLADIREISDTRIILILVEMTPEARLAARLHGADHVVGSDCDIRELAAIVRNELRSCPRSLLTARAGEDAHCWRLDEERWSLIAPNEQEIRLTRSEYDLMRILIDRAGLVQPRQLLRAAINGDPTRTRVLDAVLSRLRRKVWDCARMELPLRSARGEGYVFAGRGAG